MTMGKRWMFICACCAFLWASPFVSLGAEEAKSALEEIDPNSATAAKAEKSKPGMSFSLWPILDPGPLFTADWYKGLWGLTFTVENTRLLGQEFSFDINAYADLRGLLGPLSQDADPSFTLVDADAFGLATHLIGSPLVYRNLVYFLGFEGLYPEDAALACSELSLGLGWKLDTSPVVWHGPILAPVCVLGLDGSQPYALIDAVLSDYVNLKGNDLVLVPSLIGASILGSAQDFPARRLLDFSNRYFLRTRAMSGVDTDPEGLCSSLCGASLGLRLKVLNLAHDLGVNKEGIDLFLGLNAWGAYLNPIQRQYWMEEEYNAGFSLALALVMTQNDKPSRSPFVLKVGSSVKGISSINGWYFSILYSTGIFPIGPAPALDWFW